MKTIKWEKCYGEQYNSQRKFTGKNAVFFRIKLLLQRISKNGKRKISCILIIYYDDATINR